MTTCAPFLEASVAARPAPAPLRMHVGLVGPGKVGRALLDQLAAAAPRLRGSCGVTLQVAGAIDSRRMWLGTEGPPPAPARFPEPADLQRFGAWLRASGEHAVVVDCSASAGVAARYADWLAAGLHVVTPNKLAASGDLAAWHGVRRAALAGRAQLRYEATVGAGLPVVQTLRDLLDTGDELLAVEGMLSGTLAWLCNRFDGRRPFSALVREAHALGYTEPDPREDLGGMDVARKLVILAREAGRELDLQQVEVDGLVPASMAGLSRMDFLARLEELDAPLAKRRADVAAQGKVLRFVGRLGRDGRARVGLQALAADHAFAHTRLTDNVVQFRTRRYCDNPLVVQGPGAGPEVTAAGVFGDLLRVASALGARP